MEEWSNLKYGLAVIISLPLFIVLLYITSKTVATAIFNSYLEMRSKMNKLLLDNIREILSKQGGKEDVTK